MDRIVRASEKASQQSGLLTYVQARDLGFSKSSIQRLVASGRWERVLPRVFRLWEAEDRWRQDVTAAGLFAGDAGTISHRSAGVWWGLDSCERSSIEISLPFSTRPPGPKIVVHRSEVPHSDRGRSGCLWITTPTRTLLDLASVVGNEHLEMAVHSAIRDRRTSLQRLSNLVRRSQGRAGVRSLRALLDDLADAGVTESPLEAKLLQTIRRHRLPMPRRQFEIHGDGGFIARVDFAYPDRKVAIEVDGFSFHSSRADLRRDHQRLNRLQREGWIVLFVSADDLIRPGAFVDRLGELLGPQRLAVMGPA